jgi:heptosyltransferase-3
MKILILKFKTIGDVLLITPLISNLKQYYQNSAIDVAINYGTEQMLTGNLNVNQLIIYNREEIKNKPIASKIYNEYLFLQKIRVNKYDMVIDLDQGDRGALISKYSRANIKIGSIGVKSKLVKNTYTHFLPEKGVRHIVETNLDPLRVLNIPIKSKKVEIFWDKEDVGKLNRIFFITEKFIHIHPFSKVKNKELDVLVLSKIIDFCENTLKVKVVITAAPIKRELEQVKKISLSCDSNPINLGGKLTLKQIAILNKKSKLFIGVDTAIMHISAANSTPVLAFFGPTSPDIWGPWDNDVGHADFHRNGGIQIDRKHRVFSDRRDCLPCNNRGCNNTNISDCLMFLDINVIKKNIQEMLNE